MKMNPPKLGDPEKVLGVTLGCKPDEIAPNVVITPFLPLKGFLRLADEGTVNRLNPPFFFSGFTANYKGVPVTVINCGVGPSRVGDCLSFISLTPAREVLFAGAVGSLHPEWEIGELFLPSEAVDGEGYTRYATMPFDEILRSGVTIPSDGGLDGNLLSHLEGCGAVVRKGRVFTIGSIAFESDENLNLLVEAGFDAIEMEISAFYAGARYHGLKGAALTYISDRPLVSPLWDEKSEEEAKALGDAYRSLPSLCLDFFLHLKGARG